MLLSRGGTLQGVFSPKRGAAIDLRVSHFRKLTSETGALEAARAWVVGKIDSQLDVARQFFPCDTTCEEGLRRASSGARSARSLDSLRGFEGSASAAYFRALATKSPAWAPMGPRSVRPAQDPMNALLNLGYAALAGEVWVAAESAGLDPWLGALHQPDPHRPGLVYDLMECLRAPCVDTLVLDLLLRRRLREHHFERQADGSMRLSRAALKTFFEQWAEVSDRDEIASLAVRSFVRWLSGEDIAIVAPRCPARSSLP